MIDPHALRTLIEQAMEEIDWWANEHGCCAGHETAVMKQLEALLSTLPETPQKVYEVRSGWYEDEYLVGFYRTLEEAMATKPGEWHKVEIPVNCVGHGTNFWQNGKDWACVEITEVHTPDWLTRLLNYGGKKP